MIFEKIAEVLAERSGMDVASITMETTFADLKLDSLDTVDTLMGLEDVFGVTLEVSDGLSCVGDVVALVKAAGVAD